MALERRERRADPALLPGFSPGSTEGVGTCTRHGAGVLHVQSVCLGIREAGQRGIRGLSHEAFPAPAHLGFQFVS